MVAKGNVGGAKRLIQDYCTSIIDFMIAKKFLPSYKQHLFYTIP